MDRLQYSLPWQIFVSLSSNDLNTALSTGLLDHERPLVFGGALVLDVGAQ
jgi:hypothetical protein